jgi:peptidylprolyl isomerase
MPPSKEVRARQNRQKERIAAQRADRQRINARRKRIAVGVGLVAFAGAVALVLAVMSHDNGGNKAAATPTTAPTTAKVASVKSKPCVGLKDPLPKGSPVFTVPVGPAPTKLTWRDLKTGTGAVIPEGAKVSVNYVGVNCSTGKIFDSSYKRSQPLEADLSGQMIDGWKQGVPGMRIGGVRVLAIPASLAYQKTGGVAEAKIAANDALYFLVAPVKLG